MRQNDLRPAVSGDAGETRELRLNGVQTLQGASNVECAVYAATGKRTVFPCSIFDAAARIVTVPFGQWLRLDPGGGTYQVEIIVDSGLPSELTWPTVGNQAARIPVRDQIGIRSFVAQGATTLEDVTSDGVGVR